MQLGIIGQRPYSVNVRPEEREFALKRTHAGVDHYFSQGANTLLTGLAPGPGQWAAIAAVRNRMDLIGVLPFPNEHHGRYWTDDQREQYEALLSVTTRVWTAYPSYEFAGYSLANQWLVDHADAMLLVTNGSRQGGTWDGIVRTALAERFGAVIHTRKRRVIAFHNAAQLAVALDVDVDTLRGRAREVAA